MCPAIRHLRPSGLGSTPKAAALILVGIRHEMKSSELRMNMQVGNFMSLVFEVIFPFYLIILKLERNGYFFGGVMLECNYE